MADKNETSEHAHPNGASGTTTDRRAAKATEPTRLVERAVLLPIGAGLVVRDDIRSSLRKVSKKYGTTAGLEKELNRFEKRGIRTRNRLERQVKRQRTQLERDVRARRRRLEDHAASFGKRFEGPAQSVGKRLEGPVQTVNTTVDGVTTKIEELLSSAHGLIG